MVARFAPLALLFASLVACSGASHTDLDGPSGPASTASSSSGAPTASGSSPSGPSQNSPEGAAQTTDATSPTDDGPIRIKNVSFSKSSPSYPTKSAVDVTFAIEKKTSKTIDRLQEISLTFGGERRTFAASCQGAWLEVGGVFTLHVESDNSASSVDVDCGSRVYAESLLPWNDDVTVEMKGLLGDATPWKAVGKGNR